MNIILHDILRRKSYLNKCRGVIFLENQALSLSEEGFIIKSKVIDVSLNEIRLDRLNFSVIILEIHFSLTLTI